MLFGDASPYIANACAVKANSASDSDGSVRRKSRKREEDAIAEMVRERVSCGLGTSHDSPTISVSLGDFK